jgi:predicted small lipoprotein YifL
MASASSRNSDSVMGSLAFGQSTPLKNAQRLRVKMRGLILPQRDSLMRRLCLLVLASLLLAACGAKGPLYLPKPDQGKTQASQPK